jgi:serine/threonine protein kinase
MRHSLGEKQTNSLLPLWLTNFQSNANIPFPTSYLSCLIACSSSPFADDTFEGLHYKIVSQAPVLPNHLSADAKSFVSALLAKDPLHRLIGEQVLLHSFLKGILTIYFFVPLRVLFSQV